MKFKKKDKYPKYLYVIYDDGSPIYVGVTALPVEVRFSSNYRSEYIMKNKKKLTYRVVDLIKTKEELIKEEELILHFLEKGYKLENKVIAFGSGLPTGERKPDRRSGKLRYVPKKIGGESESILEARRKLKSGRSKKSYILERPEKIQKIKDLLDSGYNLLQISKILNIDYGSVWRFHDKYIKEKP